MRYDDTAVRCFFASSFLLGFMPLCGIVCIVLDCCMEVMLFGRVSCLSFFRYSFSFELFGGYEMITCIRKRNNF
ncbi:hypothetical protein F5884DRAFT_807781 [Xylogone sp. PMI_703]|nr:hypothetical protein F5884DRAFT_807781 [Xylogone sp. PMI_703]